MYTNVYSYPETEKDSHADTETDTDTQKDTHIYTPRYMSARVHTPILIGFFSKMDLVNNSTTGLFPTRDTPRHMSARVYTFTPNLIGFFSELDFSNNRALFQKRPT